MQDRFRVRVWNKKTKEMIYNAEYAYDGVNYNSENQIYKNNNDGHICCLGEYLDYFEIYEPMQCTGLKDKNGKLIYEGDIVDCYVSSKKIYRYQVKQEIGSFMLVSQKEEIFNFINKWNDNVYPLSQLYFEYENEENFIDQCAVVGNIYENPELLESEN